MFKNPNNIVTGAFTYIMNYEFLKKIFLKTKKIKYVDVIDGYYKNLKYIEKIKLEKILISNKKIRLTIDYLDDYIFFKKIFTKIKFNYKTKDIVKFLLKDNSLIKINYYLNKLWKKNQLNEIKKK